MTCKDCVHYEVCAEQDAMLGEKTIDEIKGVEKHCEFFKPKSRFVELPCEVGQTVYFVGKNRVKETTVGEMFIFKPDDIHISLYFGCDYECKECPFNTWKQDYSGEYSCDGEYGQCEVTNEDFGKTVFLSREEAELALKEREKE